MTRSNRKLLFIVLGSVAACIGVSLVLIKTSPTARKTLDNIKKAILAPQQEAFISKLNPAVQSLFRSFINEVQKSTGYLVIITSGGRSYDNQANLDSKDSVAASADSSYHRFGLALDINLQKTGYPTLKKASSKSSWENTGVPDIAKKYNLRWGGDFKTTPYDPIHFDAGNYFPTAKLKELALNKYGSLKGDLTQMNLSGVS